MANNDQLERFEEEYRSFYNANLQWYNLEELGELNLKSEITPILANATKRLNQIKEFAKALPDDLLTEATSIFKYIRKWAYEHSHYGLPWFAENRQVILDRFLSFEKEINEMWARLLPYYLENLISEENFDAKNQIQQKINEIEELRKKSAQDSLLINEYRSKLEYELEKFEKDYKPLLAKGELLNQEDIFIGVANKSRKESYVWILAIGLILATIITYACYLTTICYTGIECIIGNSELQKRPQEYFRFLFYFSIFRNILLRFFIISVLLYLLKFAVKNYNAVKHNQMISLHKANSFAAAPILASRVKADNGQDSIIETASKEIFTQRETGFITKEEKDLDMNVLDKLSNIISTLKK
jgi:hypothetical protein